MVTGLAEVSRLGDKFKFSSCIVSLDMWDSGHFRQIRQQEEIAQKCLWDSDKNTGQSGAGRAFTICQHLFLLKGNNTTLTH